MLILTKKGIDFFHNVINENIALYMAKFNKSIEEVNILYAKHKYNYSSNLWLQPLLINEYFKNISVAPNLDNSLNKLSYIARFVENKTIPIPKIWNLCILVSDQINFTTHSPIFKTLLGNIPNFSLKLFVK